MIASAEPDNGYVGHKLTPGRLFATTDAFLGLITVIFAGRTLARLDRIGNAARNGTIALVMGSIVLIYGVIHLNIFTGGLGTGAGRAGAFVAIVLGLVSVVLGGITLSRSRRSR